MDALVVLFIFFFTCLAGHRLPGFQKCSAIFIETLEMSGKRPAKLWAILDGKNLIHQPSDVFDLPRQS